jgi:hypothetical protein
VLGVRGVGACLEAFRVDLAAVGEGLGHAGGRVPRRGEDGRTEFDRTLGRRQIVCFGAAGLMFAAAAEASVATMTDAATMGTGTAPMVVRTALRLSSRRSPLP